MLRKRSCCVLWSVDKNHTKQSQGASLVAQYKESTCQHRRHGLNPWFGKIPLGTSEPVHHNYWACALEPGSCNSRACALEPWAHVLQGLKPRCLRARALQRERPPQWEACSLQPECSPCSPQLEKSLCSNEDPGQPKIKKKVVHVKMLT